VLAWPPACQAKITILVYWRPLASDRDRAAAAEDLSAQAAGQYDNVSNKTSKQPIRA
jgi:hypothetical protein